MRRWLFGGSCRRVMASLDLRCRDISAEDKTSSSFSNKQESKRNMSFGVDQQNLDLSLNLDKMNFKEVVEATKSAMMREKLRRHDVVPNEWNPTEDVTGVADEKSASSTVHETAHPASRSTIVSSTNPSVDTKSGRTIRGIVGAGAAHDTNSMRVVSQQRVAEGGRYSLMDTLRDCALTGNWTKAMQLFDNAILMACKMESDTSHGMEAMNTNESLEMLSRINATTPPGAMARRSAVPRGILRWGSGHYFLLLKLLLSRFRTAEAERVWDVMKRIGFVQYQMDARMVNQCIALAQRSTQPDLISPLAPLKEHEDRSKAFRRTFVMELEALAKQKELTLNDRSIRSVQAARLADEAQGRESKPDELRADGLKVGDFAGLLRRSTSEGSTTRVLHMMTKLHVPMDAKVYAALIGALRQPRYALGDEQNSATGEESVTKEAYDAHRRQRLYMARRWFDDCPMSERTADVYNEILSLARGGVEEEEQFEQILTEFRGVSLTANGDANGGEEKESHTERESKPIITTPQWRVPPNGRTYEMLIARYRFLNDWPTVWALYSEMMKQPVKGTPRLFQTLLQVAEQHPPHGKDPHAVVLDLYAEMRRHGIDVTGIKSTVSVVNAWSATRRRRRW